MFSGNAPTVLTSNTIRNLTTNIGTGTTTGASVIGINLTSATPNQTLSRNSIFNLTNTNATAASVVTGIQINGAGANTVERNASRLQDRDEHAEAIKLLDEAIQLDPANQEFSKARETSRTAVKAAKADEAAKPDSSQ